MKNCAWLLAHLLFAFAVFADDKNHNHKDLTSAQLGTVHFPVSCASSIQKPFDRGVALLHSFWYEEAEKQFLQVAKDDPHCGMAHWGVAMSLWHQLWDQPDAKVISRGMDEVRAAKSEKLLESQGSSWITAYLYFAGDLRAQYKNGVTSFLHRDHLGSTRLVTAMNQCRHRQPGLPAVW